MSIEILNFVIFFEAMEWIIGLPIYVSIPLAILAVVVLFWTLKHFTIYSVDFSDD